MKETPYLIYNASAGSGKTFTLVKAYLAILLKSKFNDSFKNILAITFTNKAVGEMKERIIDKLIHFALHDDAINDPMLTALCTELQESETALQLKAKGVLKKILHNYAFFDVVTIDKFNHRLIRTFATDLKLPQNFEVALDTELLLKEAVDHVIARAGTDEQLTKILIDFVLEKINEDKSWNIELDIFEASKKIIQENHADAVATLKGKEIKDFVDLQKNIKTKIESFKKAIISQANETLELFTSNGLTVKDFSRGTLYTHFEKHAKNNHKTNPYGNNLEENIKANTSIYTKSLASDKKATIDSLLPSIDHVYQSIKSYHFNEKLLQNIYRNIVPLTVINTVQNELEIIKEEENLLPISEFNSIISETIKEQPAPFIYERIGERYKHYFIDEFQDTSQLQWNNILPLIDNALVSETLTGQKGSLMLVGDAKQAIYRWRGGNPEQFINLYNQESNPFQIQVETENLPRNYRSFDEVITFNNKLFKHVSNYFDEEKYKRLYELSFQETNAQKGGYVTIDFLDLDTETSRDETFANATLQQIEQCIAQGYMYSDIAILTRSNAQGVCIANFLAEHNIPIISSETLLLKNNPEIQFLNTLIQLSLQPDNKEHLGTILLYLGRNQNETSVHTFIQNALDDPKQLFQKYNFNTSIFAEKPFYEAIVYAIQQFELSTKSEAYLQYYLDVILEFNEHNKEGFAGFIAYWDKKSDKLSLTAPEGVNAVELFTIHKSKGLEFNVVIFPFADFEIQKRSQHWLHVNPEEFNGFTELLVDINSDFENSSPENNIIAATLNTLSKLDNFNTLYVALTRAVEQLHIITKQKTTERDISSVFQQLLINENLWEAEKTTYTFGKPEKSIPKTTTKSTQHETIRFGKSGMLDQFNIVTKNGLLWDTKQQKAIEKGNIIHDILAHIKTENDITEAIDNAIVTGMITRNEKANIEHSITDIIKHKQLSKYYQLGATIYNEREMIDANKNILRPDRLVFFDQEATIIDYKTGAHHSKYIHQMNAYAQVLETMNYVVKEKLLVYINEEITIEKIA